MSTRPTQATRQATIAPALRLFIPSFLVVLLASCGPPPEPCVDCPDVSGMYVETIPDVPPSKSSCNAIFITGATGPIEVLQNGADIEVYPLGLVGVLYDDLSVRFASMGVMTGAGEGELEVSGRFSESNDGTFRFRGKFRVVRLSDKCRITANITWEPPDEQALDE